jgi:hypothetical protein
MNPTSQNEPACLHAGRCTIAGLWSGALEESKLGVGGRPEVLKGETTTQALDTAELGGCHRLLTLKSHSVI